MERKQITLRIPNEVYEALKEMSEKTGMTENDVVILSALIKLKLV